MTRVGFIGAGRRARHHCLSLDAIEEVNVAAVCDIKKKTKKLATEFKIDSTYENAMRMLDRESFDGVYVVTPPSAMKSVVPAVLESGTDLFLEKPPGVHSEQTKKWSELAEANDCTTLVGFQRRFNPLAIEAKQRIEERSDVGYAVATFHKNDERERAPTPYNGLLHDGIHVVDMLAWVGGGIDSVDGHLGQLYAQSEDYDPTHTNFYSATLQLANGGVGFLHCNRTAGGRQFRFEMHGDRISAYGKINGDREQDSVDINKGNDTVRVGVEDALMTDIPDTMYYDGTHQINCHFVDCLLGKAESRIPIEMAVDSMKAVEKILLAERSVPNFEI